MGKNPVTVSPAASSGINRLVQVDRIGIRQEQADQQTNYYISSLTASAALGSSNYARTLGD